MLDISSWGQVWLARCFLSDTVCLSFSVSVIIFFFFEGQAADPLLVRSFESNLLTVAAERYDLVATPERPNIPITRPQVRTARPATPRRRRKPVVRRKARTSNPTPPPPPPQQTRGRWTRAGHLMNVEHRRPAGVVTRVQPQRLAKDLARIHLLLMIENRTAPGAWVSFLVVGLFIYLLCKNVFQNVPKFFFFWQIANGTPAMLDQWLTWNISVLLCTLWKIVSFWSSSDVLS